VSNPSTRPEQGMTADAPKAIQMHDRYLIVGVPEGFLLI
jgi:hypothetical protein